LEVAGQVFAGKGVDRATSKEICARAGANVAAINYHFGSFDRLYAEVLCEAHRRLATLESIKEAVAGAKDARGRLEAVIRMIIGALTGPVSASWVVRVLGREIASPSSAFDVLREREALPKLGVLKRIVAELMELPENHPAVARGWVSVLAPCAMLLIVDRSALKRTFPDFAISPKDADALVGHMVRFAVAGLTAVAQDVKRGEKRTN
jgi:AcrR family transcriptional regulator